MIAFLKTYTDLFLYPAVAMFVSAILTYICIRVLPLLGYIDAPGGRHIHQRPVPRGGGIAVIVTFFAVFALYALHRCGAKDDNLALWLRLFVPAALLAGIGLVDDRHELRSWIKLAVQITVAAIIWVSGAQDYIILGWTMPWYLSLILTVVWVVGIINAFNLIDGLDGLASGLAIVSAVCMAIWFLVTGGNHPEAVVMLILAGACLGFLRYNFSPARIFLGDTGSTFLGLIFAVIGLSHVDRAVTITSLLLPLLAVGVPIFDVFLAIWRRSTRKLLYPHAGGIMDGDQDHLHHRLLRKTRKQSSTAIRMYLLACIFAGIALFFVALLHSVPAIAYIVLLIAVFIAVRQLAVLELFDSAKLIQIGLVKPRKGVLINIMHPFFDLFMVGVSFVIADVSCWGGAYNLRMFIYAFAPLMLILYLAGLYRVYWLRAGLNAYCRLIVMVLIGSLVSGILIHLSSFDFLEKAAAVNLRDFLSGAMIFVLLNMSLIGLERFLLYYAGCFWFCKLALQCNTGQGKHKRTVIYGGGLKCRLYIDYLYCAKASTPQEEIVGIIDDDPALNGLHVYGFRVLGDSTQIEEIFRKVPFDEIVIAASAVRSEKTEEIRAFCSKYHLGLFHFDIVRESLGAPGSEPERKTGP